LVEEKRLRFHNQNKYILQCVKKYRAKLHINKERKEKKRKEKKKKINVE